VVQVSVRVRSEMCKLCRTVVHDFMTAHCADLQIAHNTTAASDCYTPRVLEGEMSIGFWDEYLQ